MLFTGLTTAFFSELLFGLWLTMPVMLALAAAITVLGQIVGRKEGWSSFNSFYWAFITASTVGYGDCYRLCRIDIQRNSVAVAVYAATIALATHDAR